MSELTREQVQEALDSDWVHVTDGPTGDDWIIPCGYIGVLCGAARAYLELLCETCDGTGRTNPCGGSGLVHGGGET